MMIYVVVAIHKEKEHPCMISVPENGALGFSESMKEHGYNAWILEDGEWRSV